MDNNQECQICGKIAVAHFHYGVVRSLIFLRWPEKFDGWLCDDCSSKLEHRVYAFYQWLLY